MLFINSFACRYIVSGCSPMKNSPFSYNILPFIIEFFAFCQPYFYFDQRLFEVNLQRHQRIAFF